MAKQGYGGFFMHSRVGLVTQYLSDEWFDIIRKCAEYGYKKGLQAWLYDEDRWPSGAAGGYVTQYKEFRQKMIVLSRSDPDKMMREHQSDERDPEFLVAYDILFDGPVYHVYTILQVDNLLDLNRVSDKLLQYFNHRIALQMPTKDSNVVIKDVAASMLYIEGSEWTAYRGYYFNSSKNSLTKFRPYNSLISINNK